MAAVERFGWDVAANSNSATEVTPSMAGVLALFIALCGVVWLGVMPAPYLDLAQTALAPLLR